MKKIKAVLVLLLISAIAIISCNTSNKTFGNSKKWIPEDFDPKNTILLVEKFSGNKSQEQKMEDYMAEKYSFKYEFVSLKTIMNKEGKYADTKLYKFAIISSSHAEIMNRQNGGSTVNGVMVEGTDFNFYDRSLEKQYPGTMRSSSWASATFKAMINTIEQKFN